MRIRFSKRHCLWPVRLTCGHDRLVSDATLYSRFAICTQCPEVRFDGNGEPLGRTDRFLLRSRPIERRLTLVQPDEGLMVAHVKYPAPYCG